MPVAGQGRKARITNIILRIIPMGAKLLLALYMGRYFDLSEIGIYGLVFGTVAVLGVVLGQDLIYIVIREIVDEDKTTVLRRMRDQVLHYGLNYLVLAIAVGFLIAADTFDIRPRIFLFILALTILESLATIAWFNMNALNRQIEASMLFAIRSGLWVFPVLALCIVEPAFRKAEVLLAGWTAGAILSLIGTLWCFRDYPWKSLWSQPVDWGWVRRGIKKSAPVWLGTIGLTGGTFVDRFVTDHYLDVNYVGILTFYFSFTNALLTLMQSGVMAFAGPRMIKHHKDGSHDAFGHEVRQSVKQVAFGAGIVAIGLGIAVPLFGYISKRQAFIDYESTFWLMLLGTWLRASAENYSNILYARHQDRSIWLGNLLFLIPALGGNLLFVPFFGFQGIGFSAVASSAFILVWRWQYVRSYNPSRSA